MTTRREAFETLAVENPVFALDLVDVRGIPWRVYRECPSSLRAILERTSTFGDRTFLVYENERWTYAEHLRLVKGLARQWSSWGIGKGDRVAIAMRNYPEWVMTFWAAISLGAVVVPLNAWWTADELTYGLNDAKARMLVADSERAERLADRTADLGLERIIVVARDDRSVPKGMLKWVDELVKLDLDASLPDVEIELEDDATIIYTSGTTGFPKGAIHTHRNHLTNLRNTEFCGAAAVRVAGITPPENPPQNNILQTFPYFHIGGLTGLYTSTAFGAKVCLLQKWDTAKAAAVIQKESVNTAAMVPTLYRRFLEYTAEHGLKFDSLASMGSGGAPVPADLIRQVRQQFGGRVAPSNGYGLTETTSGVALNSGEEYLEHSDSVGRLMPIADLRVVDPETGTDQPAGIVGELWFRGPNIVRGYWNKPEDTAAAFTDGWFHSGDLGYIDADNLLYVVDRLKDVIIRSGENVYCAEVEANLFEHPAVADVAVIGLPHESWGEEVVAVVELHEEAGATASELQEHVGKQLAYFKVPTRVIFITEPLPRTATGKVMKRDLRKRYLRVSGS